MKSRTAFHHSDSSTEAALQKREVLVWAITLPLLPLALLQGWWVRFKTPRLPGAAGPTTGVIESSEQTITLVVIGESTVAGIGAATHNEALTGQIAAALARLTDRTVQWQAVGLSGATAKATHDQLVSLVEAQRADAIVIALGVNDVLQMSSATRWREDLSQLIAAIRQRVGSVPVILAGVPPMAQFPALPQPLRMLLGMRAKLLDAASAHLATTIVEVIHLPIEARDDDDFCEDRFHPGPRGYAAWGAHIAETIAALLKR